MGRGATYRNRTDDLRVTNPFKTFKHRTNSFADWLKAILKTGRTNFFNELRVHYSELRLSVNFFNQKNTNFGLTKK